MVSNCPRKRSVGLACVCSGSRAARDLPTARCSFGSLAESRSAPARRRAACATIKRNASRPESLKQRIIRPPQASMTDPLTRFTTSLSYGATQAPRVAWYVGHSLLMRRLSAQARRRGSVRPQASTQAPVPDRGRLYADMAKLFLRDLANVEAGIYPLPVDHDGSLATVLARSRLFFKDLPNIHRRRNAGDHRQVLTEETRGKRPGYYLQNFHFQSGGWMTRESAQRHDTSVEVLFYATANAHRRNFLPAIHHQLVW